MRMRELIKKDIPEEVVSLWEEQESSHLLPLQERVVKQHGLFGGGNLLIQAPTSSGKTFIGEMAAIETALRQKQVVYVVPLKALAEEKFQDFHAKYTPYGMKVIIATRDRREFDRDLEEGKFSIAVVVYEKLSQLLVRQPQRIGEIDLVIADELKILSDPERGADVELLLTRILCAGSRLIGLSAVLGQADKLAQWLRADLVSHERRPVELRYGVLYEGTFRYRTYNELGEAEESMVEMEGASWQDTLILSVCALAQRGETCLVFAKTKHETRYIAEALAEQFEGEAADETMAELGQMESTRCQASLLRTLSHGVAFHNTDLQPAERLLVEETYRRGEARIMVATSTLAVGLNLPAQNVFLQAEKWRYDARLDTPWKTPIYQGEYENMGGRAGRYGAGHDYGRSILIATTPFEQDTYWRRYVEGQREGITPRLSKEPLENHVLHLVASRLCQSVEGLIDFLESTLTGRWVWAEEYTLDEIEFRIRAAINRGIEAGVMERQEGGHHALDEEPLVATPFGMAIATKGLTISSALAIQSWISASVNRNWSPIDLLLALCTTQDGQMLQVMLTHQEYEQANYPEQLRELTWGEELDAAVPLNRIRSAAVAPFFEEVRAIKVSLFLHHWIEEVALADLEEQYNTMAGQIYTAADQLAWLVDATASIAISQGEAPEGAFVQSLHILGQRIQAGLSESGAYLATSPLYKERSICIALLHGGFMNVDSLAEAPEEALQPYMESEKVAALQQWARHQILRRENTDTQTGAQAMLTLTTPDTPSPTLIVDERRPDRILLDGEAIPLQEKQFRLIRLLADSPGSCVEYEQIYSSLWGDQVVEDSQIYFQKRKLTGAIKNKHINPENIIKTIPKRGYMLALKAHEVQVISAA